MSPDLQSHFSGRNVFLTGHTGFKGAWLAILLKRLGAQVTGLALPPASWQPLLPVAKGSLENEYHQDIRHLDEVKKAIHNCQPDCIFHLAAQPLVIESYANPIDTLSTNLMGTANLLQAVSELKKPCQVVVVTSDKCYQNEGWEFSYRESDRLGGKDIYSASKAATEIIASSWNHSFFLESSIRMASARAGNVIGGGDFSPNRLMTDIVNSLSKGETIPLRNPHSIRPWQHVLDCLSGYLCLSKWLHDTEIDSASPLSFNFGPASESQRTTKDLLLEFLKHWPGDWEDTSDPTAPHEAGRLSVSIERASTVLGWSPTWTFPDAVKMTADWYREWAAASEDTAHLLKITEDQIARFLSDSNR